MKCYMQSSSFIGVHLIVGLAMALFSRMTSKFFFIIDTDLYQMIHRGIAVPSVDKLPCLGMKT